MEINFLNILTLLICSAEVEWLLKPGTRVSLNARKIRGCYLPMQVKLISILSI